MNPTISYNALARITSPQTLNMEGHIKKKNLIVLINSSSNHNFIQFKVAKELNCLLYLAPEFQVMVSNGGTINCSGKFHNIKITMGELYVLNIPMLSIPTGGVDVLLGVKWLQTLRTVAFNFQEIFLNFFQKERKLNYRVLRGSRER